MRTLIAGVTIAVACGTAVGEEVLASYCLVSTRKSRADNLCVTCTNHPQDAAGYEFTGSLHVRIHVLIHMCKTADEGLRPFGKSAEMLCVILLEYEILVHRIVVIVPFLVVFQRIDQ